jgi:hypothetical protein
MPRYPSIFSPVSVAKLAGGALSLNFSKFGTSEKLWDQIGLVDECAVWATSVGIILAALPMMPLHGLKLQKMRRFGRYAFAWSKTWNND